MGIRERKQRERERRNQQIMTAARRVLTRKGFNSTTMEDIAKEAELSPGTLYLYFSGKEALYASLSLRVLQFMNMRLKSIARKTDMSCRRRLALMAQAMYDVYQFDPLIVVNMSHMQSSEILLNLSEEVLEQIKALSRATTGAVAGLISEGIEKGVFVDRNPTALADIFWAIFSGLVLWEESKKRLNSRKDFLKDTLELAYRIFIKGIEKHAWPGYPPQA